MQRLVHVAPTHKSKLTVVDDDFPLYCIADQTANLDNNSDGKVKAETEMQTAQLFKEIKAQE